MTSSASRRVPDVVSATEMAATYLACPFTRSIKVARKRRVRSGWVLLSWEDGSPTELSRNPCWAEASAQAELETARLQVRVSIEDAVSWDRLRGAEGACRG